jgi:gliding motility-associated-like protein
MDVTNGNPTFRQEYLNRYQDLINGPLKCENLIKHWKLIDTLYSVEMLCHEDPACAAGPGKFVASKPSWVKNMTMFDSILSARCYYMEARAFQTSGCYGMNGPFAVTIDVSPTGAGKVKLNSTVLDSYPWVGHYYQTQMSFKAIPTNTNYAFHHWEFQKHTPKNPLSMDSVVVQSWTYNDNVVAVFTDVTNPISSGQNIPTGFTPNGDNNNDFFKPLGSAEYAQDFQMTIWNRWGQEVYRSTNPNDVGWDGKYHGQDVPTGVYAYIITYKNVYGESKVVKNNVTLTR